MCVVSLEIILCNGSFKNKLEMNFCCICLSAKKLVDLIVYDVRNYAIEKKNRLFDSGMNVHKL